MNTLPETPASKVALRIAYGANAEGRMKNAESAAVQAYRADRPLDDLNGGPNAVSELEFCLRYALARVNEPGREDELVQIAEKVLHMARQRSLAAQADEAGHVARPA